MNKELLGLRKIVARSLAGKGAHVATISVFEGLSWKQSGTQPSDATQTVFQLLQHIRFWQDWALQWLDGRNPLVPSHAGGSWPAAPAPANVQEWKRAVQAFKKGLRDLQSRCVSAELSGRGGEKSPLEMLQTIATHNSYHAGQVVAIRKWMGCWPPPSGGLTW